MAITLFHKSVHGQQCNQQIIVGQGMHLLLVIVVAADIDNFNFRYEGGVVAFYIFGKGHSFGFCANKNPRILIEGGPCG